MAAAGTEEKLIKVLERQGSFDPETLNKVGASPLLKANVAADDEDDGGDLVD